ncbi:hypothetical protein [Brachybacterium squillarum]|uniref:hypothetical protein n=1 Tax=Brachybacterium squillarum TaxID=661979 RepID=UPI000262976B|nr:hypothetical protein [Brachybacterium squillarum]
MTAIATPVIRTVPTAPVAAAAPGAPRGESLRRRLLRAKHVYSTRFAAAHLERAEQLELVTAGHTPAPGELVLARVTEIGQHKRLKSPASRRQVLFEGDEVLVAYGSRYAADQFLAMIPGDLGPCHLAAAGGLASRVVDQHDRIDEATVITPIGVVRGATGPLTLERPAPHTAGPRPTVCEGARVPVIVVLGTSMNSGKTTLLAQLAHGLAGAGLRGAAGKATGTGAGNDRGLFVDAVAARVPDFTDFGHSSAFGLSADRVRELFSGMVEELASGGAVGGVGALSALDRTPLLVSGVLTASPLATAETRRALEVPVVPTLDLADPAEACEAVAAVLGARARRAA